MTTSPVQVGKKATEPDKVSVDNNHAPAGRHPRKLQLSGVPVAAITGGIMLATLLTAAVVSSVAFDPSHIGTDVLQAPTWAHPFGTDSSGRDVAARTFAAALADLPLALGGTLLSAVAGTTIGLIASSGGRAADPIMRLVDGFQAFPLLILILVTVQITGGGTAVLLATLAVLNLPRFIRLTRTEAMQVSQSRYVFFAQVIGAPTRHILVRHILPNVSGAICSQASVGTAISLSAIGAMSFLGLGIAPPTPSWGSMIQQAAGGMTIGQWWPVLFPCLALVYSIVAFNLIADSLDTHFAREAK